MIQFEKIWSAAPLGKYCRTTGLRHIARRRRQALQRVKAIEHGFADRRRWETVCAAHSFHRNGGVRGEATSTLLCVARGPLATA